MTMQTVYGKNAADIRKKVSKLGKEWKFVGQDRLEDGTLAATYTLVKKKPARKAPTRRSQAKPDLFKELFG